MAVRTGEPWRVLVVCTANQCRSPMSQLLLARALEHGNGRTALPISPVEVTSAGIRATEGSPITAQTAQQLALRGVDSDWFRSRQLTDAMVRQADLVLTATLEQRSRVLDRVPLALRRTFTLLEFAAIAPVVVPAMSDTSGTGHPDETPETAGAAIGPAEMSALVRKATRIRGTAPVAEYDIEDPVGGPDEGFAIAADLIDAAVLRIAAALLAAG